MTQTRHFKKKLSATTTQQTYDFEGNEERLVRLHVLNAGSDNAFLEPDNDIDADSILIPAGMSVALGPDLLNLQYKAENTTAILYIYGNKHTKS